MRYSPGVEILRMIAYKGDSSALNELLKSRKLFVYEGRQLLLTEFLWQMREKYQMRLGSKKTVDEIIDCIYDLSLAKFANIPPGGASSLLEPQGQTIEVKHSGVDCRKYYRGILKMLEKWRDANPGANDFEQEAAVGRIFQRMVVKHFKFSMAECRRVKHPFRRRYLWKIGNRHISLRYPVQISGRYIRQWLEKHITDPDPSRPGEKERIQFEVDSFFTRHPEIPLDDRWASYELAKGGHLLADGKEYAWMPKKVDELMLTLAEEKTRNIDQMRPAIRDLGKNSLYQLIITIFDALYREKFEDNRIAKEFGLSKATFSRFAGSKWFTKLEGGAAHIPDLWMNTAKILATSPDFMELATAAGILPMLKKAMGIIGGSYD